MSFLHQYRPFFSVQLLIDYYLTEEAALYQDTPDNPMSEVLEQQRNKYNVDRDIHIVPTPETKAMLKDKQLLFKKNNLGFMVVGKVSSLGDGTFAPFSEMNEAYSLRFTLHLKNPHFYNFTNIRLEEELENKDHFIYYFSNRANNIVTNQALYLNNPVPDFNDLYAYEAGELFIDRTDPLNPIMQEAIESNGPGAFNPTNWRQIFTGINPLFQYATSLDRIVSRPSVFKVNVENTGEEALLFIITDHKGNIAKNITYNTLQPGIPLVECELDLRELHSGYYHVEVQNTIGNTFADLSLTFFLDDAIYRQRPFAIIECFHEPDGSLGEYRWLDQNNQDRLRFPMYTIRWKNRPTWWRYYHETAPSFTSASVENLDPDVNAPNNRILISTTPLALTYIGREVALNLGNGDIQLLPNPDVQMIYPENGRIYSELNMGGGFGPPD